MKHSYELIVGNIGTVLRTTSVAHALKEYAAFKRLSKQNYGSAAGEDVTLFKNGEILIEFTHDTGDAE